MDLLSENNIPWHLISDALQGNLNTEEEAVFQQWMAAAEQNRELFMQLKDAWQNGLDDYPVYQQASETVAWNALHSKLKEPAIVVEHTPKKRARLIRVVSIAAVLVLATGLVTWYMMTNSGNTYNTGNAEQRSVSLADGTVIKLFPATSIEVPAGYNRSVRRVILKKGAAFFEVPHQEEMPFIVDLGSSTVKDIGTSFRIQRTNDSIDVSVITGEIEFRNRAGNQVRLLSAGMRLQFLPALGNARSVLLVDSLPAQYHDHLRFISTPLPEVIRSFKAIYNKQIIIIDTVLTQKRFTGNLQGQSFEVALNVLCKSLAITFVHENDVYYLKKE